MHTNLGEEVLYAAVGGRWNLGLHEILNELSHFHILNQTKAR